MKRAAIAAAALALALTGCSAADPESTADGTVSQDTFLTTHGLAAMDAVEIIDHLDRQKVTERPTDLIASVRADELLLSSDDQEVVVDLPDNQTYVSIAPYLTSTHDCFYHSLTTCLGELDNEDIQVTITDEATGEVLVDEATTTFDNGFIGFWLPDDVTGLIEVSYQGRTGTTEFSTTDDGATCVTDLRLT
ncbi:CueP family metal-binding protein [Corynebacterium pseudodiphtheriticum]|uniref:CueP family metal-binding protein n=1 Tax=Corynebacterium pseudodiphtheriticum TaxID=37637 RepID=UPI00047C3CBB|nr:CueP family metal-binding protein [Corynebacterium pseudodiphtheriticum]MDC7069184.1 CueP family metal-binding protein [Corynebacterium pseudodiphtheriticum]MDC7085249.1 CueP family metal-binding protein [Corynebacterium pseudodiphtheriticum]MDC7087263.1 CueP family metal-binding protein [Corynebacterium pseudodiphtheriticum]MDC7112780.1 CueP family metal-binding protein [Corynebacterium pseudodiphtheriticum]MDK4296736.1 CueP family metal-binding protein [Corynebacterium pseudodiphtheriticu